MPPDAAHNRLRRLPRVWIEPGIFFVTTCTRERKKLLTIREAPNILREELKQSGSRHGWTVGRFVIMPDHVHFFCAPTQLARPLDRFVGSWKEWTAKRLIREQAIASPLWQEGFFDHLLRSTESYSQKWDYVRMNPVRAGLCERPEDWPHAGEINPLNP